MKKYTIPVLSGFIFISLAIIMISRTSGRDSSLLSRTEGVLSSFSSAFKQDQTSSYIITPEYSRTLKRVVISSDHKIKTLKYHHEILARLPLYTEIIWLIPEQNLESIRAELKNKFYGPRVRFVAYQTKPQKGARLYLVFPEKEKLIEVEADKNRLVYQQGTNWARDLFITARKQDGTTLVLISDVYKWFISYGDKSSLRVTNDNSFLQGLSAHNIDLLRLPLTFQGGNIMADEFQGKRIVFYGGNILRATRTVWQSTLHSSPTDAQLIKKLKESLNVDEAYAVGRNKIQPPSLMFHLDQGMILLKDRVAGLTNIVGKPNLSSPQPSFSGEIEEVELFLAELRLKLLQAGYRVVNIDTSVHNIINHQQYVNAIPYIDAETGQHTLLMPVFASAQTSFDKELIQRNTDLFQSLGYRVIHIPTDADRFNGGLHCLVNTLE